VKAVNPFSFWRRRVLAVS